MICLFIDFVNICSIFLLNYRIQKVLAEIAESHLKPAIRNLRFNLGEENVPAAALQEVCISALENAKEVPFLFI